VEREARGKTGNAVNKKKKNHTNQIKKGPVAHQEDMLIDKNNKSTNKNTQKSKKKKKW